MNNNTYQKRRQWVVSGLGLNPKLSLRAIKVWREVTGCTLPEAKRWHDGHINLYSGTLNHEQMLRSLDQAAKQNELPDVLHAFRNDANGFLREWQVYGETPADALRHFIKLQNIV